MEKLLSESLKEALEGFLKESLEEESKETAGGISERQHGRFKNCWSIHGTVLEGIYGRFLQSFLKQIYGGILYKISVEIPRVISKTIPGKNS